MPVHVQQRGRQQLGHVITFVELVGFLDFVDQFLRHGFAGFVVFGEVRKDFGIAGPVFVEL
ncbi:hypothetical protein D3C80_2105360 [compost metagenome]